MVCLIICPTRSCFFQVAICHGPYPKPLVKAWHTWDKKNGSENDPVDSIGTMLPESSSLPGGGKTADPTDATAAALLAGQLFLVIAMGDSGRDLEKHELTRGLDEARAILAQVRSANPPLG